nr:MAG TPA: PORTAL PROTEIN [Caudoviricetes sp.]
MVKKSVAVSHTDEVLSQAFNSPLAQNQKFKKELTEVELFYQYFDGFDVRDLNSDYGQTWKINEEGIDYEPTREIRNFIRQLVKKQARFMMGKEPELSFSPLQTGQDEAAENKRILFDFILSKSKFWTKAANALVDATVGKRVLMLLVANENEKIDIQFYSMPQFTYTVDPKNPSRLLAVDIVYQDERTKGMQTEAQLWHHFRYEMKSSAKESGVSQALENVEEECWLTYALTDGEANQIYMTEDGGTTIKASLAKLVEIEDNLGNKVEVPLKVLETAPTGLSQIPCRVILNEPLTNDIYGSSDVKELITIADNYNRTVSDMRDALKFKMFEQPVLIDASTASVKGMKIAPNALVDVKSDPASSIGSGGNSRQAKVATISGSFNFLPAAQYYLDEAKKAMYELMDQPLPEKVQNAPSGIAMQFLFYDLMSRCDSKWIEWDSAIEWLVEMLEEVLEKVNVDLGVLPDNIISSYQTLTTLVIDHKYPLPSDEVSAKQVALSEVQSNVRSHQSYIEEFSVKEKADKEWQRVLEEQAQLDEVSGGALPQLVDELGQPQFREDTDDDKEKEQEERAKEKSAAGEEDDRANG